MPAKPPGRDKYCPECRGLAYIDAWRPPIGFDKRYRRFICSDCGAEFLLLVRSSYMLRYYGRVLGRR